MTISIVLVCSGCGEKERTEFANDEDPPMMCSKCTPTKSKPEIESFDPAAPRSMEHFEGFGYT